MDEMAGGGDMHEDFYQSQCLGEQKMLPKCLHRGSDTGIYMCTAQSLYYIHLAVIRKPPQVGPIYACSPLFHSLEEMLLVSNTSVCC